MEQYGQDARLRLKAAFKRVVKLAGGVEMAASDVGKQPSQISRWQNKDHMADFPPISVVVDLEAVAGEAVVTREMLRLLDPAGAEALDDHVETPLMLAAHMQVAAGHMTESAIAAAQDGRLDNHELDDLIAKTMAAKVATDNAYDQMCRIKAARMPKAVEG